MALIKVKTHSYLVSHSSTRFRSGGILQGAELSSLVILRLEGGDGLQTNRISRSGANLQAKRGNCIGKMGSIGYPRAAPTPCLMKLGLFGVSNAPENQVLR